MKASFDRPLILDNGLMLMLHHCDGEEVSIEARVLMGSFDEMLDKDVGISNLINKMVWLGTEDFSRDELYVLCDSDDISTGGESRRDFSSYAACCTKVRFMNALEILDSVVFRPKLGVEASEEGKRFVRHQIEANEEDMMAQATLQCLRDIFPNHKVVNNPLGDSDVVDDIRVTRMREFVRGFHRPQTILLSMSGDLPAYEDLEPILDEHASAFVRKTRAANQDPLPRIWGDPTIIDEETHEVSEWGDEGTSNIVLIIPIAPHLHTARNRLILSLLSRSLAGHRSAGFDFATYGDVGWLRYGATCSWEEEETTISEALDSLSDVAKGNLHSEDFDAGKSALRSNMEHALTTTGGWNILALNAMMDEDVYHWPDKVIPEIDQIERSDVCDLVDEIVSSHHTHGHTIRR